MNELHWLTYYPAVRLAFPFALGIIVSKSLCGIPLSLLLAVAFVLWLSVCVTLRIHSSAICGISIVSLAFLLGAACYGEYARSIGADWDNGRRNYVAVLQELPVERNKSFLLKVRISDTDTSVNGADVYLYVPKTESVLSLQPGNALCFNGTVKGTAEENGSEYGRYLYGKGISGTLWVDSSHWHRLDGVNCRQLRYRLAVVRGKMSDLYGRCGLSDKALAVVLSVILSDKSMLNDDTRNTFSASGASHMLAVSGLHVGILYACLSLLIPSFASMLGRILKELAILAVLWAYASIIGMPLSITRSLVMFSVAFVCRCLRRDNTSINSLAIAAVVILSANPDGLYDVGFQLSFLAVFYILFLHPPMSEILKPENPAVAYIWNLIVVSVSAQIGTAPLVAYVFNALPSYFLITNIVAIPVMFVIVACAMLLPIVSFVPFAGHLMADVVSFSVDFLDNAMKYIVDTPGSVMETPIDNVAYIYLVYVLLVAVPGWIIQRKTIH